MSNAFFKILDPDTAQDVEQLSRAIYGLRESRKQVLAEAGCEDEAALLDGIRNGSIAEHPGYELYLAARVMDQAREDARMALRPQPDDRPAHCLHAALRESVQETFATRLAAPIQLMQDALRLGLDNGLELTARFAADDEWSVEWCRDDATARIDTAPDAANQGRVVAHLHDAAGNPRAQPPCDTTGAAEQVLCNIVGYLLETHERG